MSSALDTSLFCAPMLHSHVEPFPRELLMPDDDETTARILKILQSIQTSSSRGLPLSIGSSFRRANPPAQPPKRKGSFAAEGREALTPPEILLAVALDLPASEVERATGFSCLSALVSAALSDSFVDDPWFGAFRWALSTGASLELASLEFPSAPAALARVEGGPAAASELLDAGFPLPDLFDFRSPVDGSIQGSILHLLLAEAFDCFDLAAACSALAPACSPAERDSRGYTALGRLNREASKRPESAVWVDAFKALAAAGHDPADLSPPPELVVFSRELAPFCSASAERAALDEALSFAPTAPSEPPPRL